MATAAPAPLTRPDQVDRDMAILRNRLASSDFKVVRPARWRHLRSGHEVETGYTYGEGRYAIFLQGGRTAHAEIRILGRDNDLELFDTMFPAHA